MISKTCPNCEADLAIKDADAKPGYRCLCVACGKAIVLKVAEDNADLVFPALAPNESIFDVNDTDAWRPKESA